MQSVYKLLIAMAVLDQVDRGNLNLDRRSVSHGGTCSGRAGSPIRDRYPKGGVEFTVRELLRFMVSESDGTASDVLLRMAGGPAKVTADLRGIGVTDMLVAAASRAHHGGAVPELGHSGRVARVARQGARPAAAPIHDRQRDRSAPAQGTVAVQPVLAHKTGTSGTYGGISAATNDIGLITLPNGRHVAIAVFVSDSKAGTETREGVIARIARAVWDCWSR